jgi:hypothetical protein
MKRLFTFFLLGLCAVLILFVGYMNIEAIAGAFGEGPPYYGRTTNMDKWKNPLPLLGVVDASTVLIVGLCGRWALGQIR